MDLRKIKKLIELLQRSGVAEIEITEGKESLRIRTTDTSLCVGESPVDQITNEASPSPVTSNITIETSPPHTAENLHTVTSPMVGTVYLAPTPDTQPYVQVGQDIQIGDTICMIESMKMRNKIVADKTGKVVSVSVENGGCVEYGQPLIIIE